MITSHDVAKLAGVSQPTVSRALRDVPGVSMQTRSRVRDAARALGYVPSQAGRSLSTRTTGLIGIVTDQLANPFYPSLVDPLHRRLAERGYRTILVVDHGQDEVAIETLVDGSLDGVILTTSELSSELPLELSRRGMPSVLVNRLVKGSTVDECTADDAHGAGLVADLFVGLGHRRIAAIFGPQTTSTGRAGAEGFRSRLQVKNVDLPESMVRTGPFTTEHGAHALATLLNCSERPTAIFCANDVVAMGALNTAVTHGLRVPEDLSIVGFDDIPMASWARLNLTTVHAGIDELARTAADMILARIKHPESPQRSHVEPVRLVLRGTHAPPPSHTPPLSA